MNHSISTKIATIVGLAIICSVILPSGVSRSAGYPDQLSNPGIVISEVVFFPAESDYEWVELKNIGDTPVKIDGFALTDEDNTWFEIPVRTPDVPPGAYVVVIFDGLGSINNDYDFSDNLVVLHTRRVTSNAFADVDQVALYDDYVRSTNKPNTVPPQIVSFVAWGDNPGSDAANAVAAGIWLEGTYVGTDLLEPGYSIGLIPESQTTFYDDFSVYVTNMVTQGSDNYYPKGLCIEIPAGEFQMGCDPDHNGGYPCYEGDELPLHAVYLDEYHIDVTEVTNQQYAQCVAAGACSQPHNYSSFTRDAYYNTPEYADYPVIYVDWQQALDYCTWVDGSLPTEAQWEKSARPADAFRAFPWGDDIPDCSLANFHDIFGSGGYCVGDTSAVGSYPDGASPDGLLDMAGNILEWTSDWYQSDYYEDSPYYNPTGPDAGTTKVIRGGSWENIDIYQRLASRISTHPMNSLNYIGFRCAFP